MALTGARTDTDAATPATAPVPAGRRPWLLEAATVLMGLAVAPSSASTGHRPGRPCAGVVVVPRPAVGGAPRQARARGRIAAAMGVLATSVGLGLAPHLAKDGPLPVRVASTLLLVGGLALLVGGTAVALRGRHWPRRRLGCGRRRGDRDRGVGRLAGGRRHQRAASHARRHAGGGGLTASAVSIPTTDGVRLAGWYVPSTNDAAVVLRTAPVRPGPTSSTRPAVLADAGFGVLMVDARGHGESGGRAMDFWLVRGGRRRRGGGRAGGAT